MPNTQHFRSYSEPSKPLLCFKLSEPNKDNIQSVFAEEFIYYKTNMGLMPMHEPLIILVVNKIGQIVTELVTCIFTDEINYCYHFEKVSDKKVQYWLRPDSVLNAYTITGASCKN